jgi:hypothetical protein
MISAVLDLRQDPERIRKRLKELRIVPLLAVPLENHGRTIEIGLTRTRTQSQPRKTFGVAPVLIFCRVFA